MNGCLPLGWIITNKHSGPYLTVSEAVRLLTLILVYKDRWFFGGSFAEGKCDYLRICSVGMLVTCVLLPPKFTEGAEVFIKTLCFHPGTRLTLQLVSIQTFSKGNVRFH